MELSVSWERQRQTDHYHTNAIMEVCLGSSGVTREVPASNNWKRHVTEEEKLGLWQKKKA